MKVGSVTIGVIVGAISALALRHAHDPSESGLSLSFNGLEAAAIVLGVGLIVGPLAALGFGSARLIAAAGLAFAVGAPVFGAVLGLTLRGDAAGGYDRFFAWTFAIAAMYALAGVAAADRAESADRAERADRADGAGRRRAKELVVAGVALVVGLSTVATLELTRQNAWRAWDVAHHDVALVLPDVPGYEPTGMRFFGGGIEVELTGGGGSLSVDLLDRKASESLVCDGSACGDSWSSGTVVKRRHAGRLVSIRGDGGARVTVDVPLRPVSAERLARLPELPPPTYED